MSWKRTFDGPEPQRVNKWLAHAGVCSRREAETLIEAGAVYIDGEQVTDVGRKIAPGQTLVLNDRAELGLGAQISVVIHKPVGVVSEQPDPGQIPAARLLTDLSTLSRGRARPLLTEAGVDLAPTTDAGLLALTQAVAALQRDKRL